MNTLPLGLLGPWLLQPQNGEEKSVGFCFHKVPTVGCAAGALGSIPFPGCVLVRVGKVRCQIESWMLVVDVGFWLLPIPEKNQNQKKIRKGFRLNFSLETLVN